MVSLVVAVVSCHVLTHSIGKSHVSVSNSLSVGNSAIVAGLNGVNDSLSCCHLSLKSRNVLILYILLVDQSLSGLDVCLKQRSSGVNVGLLLFVSLNDCQQLGSNLHHLLTVSLRNLIESLLVVIDSLSSCNGIVNECSEVCQLLLCCESLSSLTVLFHLVEDLQH